MGSPAPKGPVVLPASRVASGLHPVNVVPQQQPFDPTPLAPSPPWPTRPRPRAILRSRI
jgi:hypothetical protein